MCATRPSDQGFTLIEMLVAVVIMALGAILTFSVLRFSSTEGASIVDQMQDSVHAAQNFASDTGCYPSTMADMGPAGANGASTGLFGCSPDNAHWNGPYLESGSFLNGNLSIPQSQSGEPNSIAQIETGTWLANNPEMQGRGANEIAVVLGPVSPQVSMVFCKKCGGCAAVGSSTPPSTCFTTGNDVGEVFATAQ